MCTGEAVPGVRRRTPSLRGGGSAICALIVGSSWMVAGTALAAGPGAEVAAMRSATSRTYRQADGRFITRFAQEPVNFWDAAGRSWRPIDNTLVAAGDGTLRNARNRFSVTL